MGGGKKTAIEMAIEAGFDPDLPALKDGTAIALKLIEIVRMEEREACKEDCRGIANLESPFDRDLREGALECINAIERRTLS